MRTICTSVLQLRRAHSLVADIGDRRDAAGALVRHRCVDRVHRLVGPAAFAAQTDEQFCLLRRVADDTDADSGVAVYGGCLGSSARAVPQTSIATAAAAQSIRIIASRR